MQKQELQPKNPWSISDTLKNHKFIEKKSSILGENNEIKYNKIIKPNNKKSRAKILIIYMQKTRTTT